MTIVTNAPVWWENVANVEMLPIPMLPVANWGLELDIGNTGNN